MKNPTKLHAKSKLEKVMPKWCQHDKKSAQHQAQIDEKNMRKIDRTNKAKKLENRRKIRSKFEKGRHFEPRRASGPTTMRGPAECVGPPGR